MKTIARMMIGSVFAAVLAAAFSNTCFAGPEAREIIKEDTKAAVEKTREVAKEVAAETKELAKKSGEQAKEVAGDVAEHAQAIAKKTAVVTIPTKRTSAAHRRNKCRRRGDESF